MNKNLRVSDIETIINRNEVFNEGLTLRQIRNFLLQTNIGFRGKNIADIQKVLDRGIRESRILLVQIKADDKKKGNKRRRDRNDSTREPPRKSRKTPTNVNADIRQCLKCVDRRTKTGRNRPASSSTDKTYHKCLPQMSPISYTDPSEWSVQDVVSFIKETDESLEPYVEHFRTQEIDGKALLLLNSEIMIKYMNLKVGPMLKLSRIIEKLKARCNQ